MAASLDAECVFFVVVVFFFTFVESKFITAHKAFPLNPSKEGSTSPHHVLPQHPFHTSDYAGKGTRKIQFPCVSSPRFAFSFYACDKYSSVRSLALLLNL